MISRMQRRRITRQQLRLRLRKQYPTQSSNSALDNLDSAESLHDASLVAVPNTASNDLNDATLSHASLGIGPITTGSSSPEATSLESKECVGTNEPAPQQRSTNPFETPPQKCSTLVLVSSLVAPFRHPFTRNRKSSHRKKNAMQRSNQST